MRACPANSTRSRAAVTMLSVIPRLARITERLSRSGSRTSGRRKKRIEAAKKGSGVGRESFDVGREKESVKWREPLSGAFSRASISLERGRSGYFGDRSVAQLHHSPVLGADAVLGAGRARRPGVTSASRHTAVCQVAVRRRRPRSAQPIGERFTTHFFGFRAAPRSSSAAFVMAARWSAVSRFSTVCVNCSATFARYSF